MALASGILWIIFGIVYVLYRSMKDNAGATLAGVLMFIGFFSVMATVVMISQWISGYNILLGGAFLIAVIIAAAVYALRSGKNYQKKVDKIIEDMREKCGLNESDHEE